MQPITIAKMTARVMPTTNPTIRPVFEVLLLLCYVVTPCADIEEDITVYGPRLPEEVVDESELAAVVVLTLEVVTDPVALVEPDIMVSKVTSST